MTEHTASGQGAGWQIGQSIVLELEFVLDAIKGSFPTASLPPEFAPLVTEVPDEWRAELAELLDDTRGESLSLSYLADVAGVWSETDFGRATLAIRELDLPAVVEHVRRVMKQEGFLVETLKSDPEQLAAVVAEHWQHLYSRYGLESSSKHGVWRRMNRQLLQAMKVLKEGVLSGRFWHWIDRYYYEIYRPWRQTQQTRLAALERRALTTLGSREGEGRPPPLDWLSHTNPLLRYPELGDAVRQGELRVFFWVEPFALSDAILLTPGLVRVSFAEPETHRNFEAFSEDLARRVKALSDPTRLIILRLIRNFRLDNTQMAAYLDVARPTVSVHAKILREAGLIRSRQEGRQVYHEIVPEEVQRLFDDLERFLDLPG